MAINARIDGRTVQIEPPPDAGVHPVEPGVFLILTGGRSCEARVEPAGDGVWVTVNGRGFYVVIVDPRGWNRRAAGVLAEGRENITAPMPGKIVRLLVAAGDEVRAGQGVVVVEAMKMQNEMRTARTGRVVSIPVGEGQTVAAGAVLATIE